MANYTDFFPRFSKVCLSDFRCYLNNVKYGDPGVNTVYDPNSIYMGRLCAGNLLVLLVLNK